MKPREAIHIEKMKKRFHKFTLDIKDLSLPEGFVTVVVGENGSGKSTMLRFLSGMRRDYEGKVMYNHGQEWSENLADSIGFLSIERFFMMQWTADSIKELSSLLFSTFNSVKYERICEYLGIEDGNQRVAKMSAGTRMKTALAAIWARNTDILLLDEPSSPLDPLTREKLEHMIREYIEEGEGKKTVICSTHNIEEMEDIADYCVILHEGKVREAGFVEDLKEKYTMIKGEKIEEEKKKVLIGFEENSYGYEGLCLDQHLEMLNTSVFIAERPSLSQLCISIMRQAEKEKRGRKS